MTRIRAAELTGEVSRRLLMEIQRGTRESRRTGSILGGTGLLSDVVAAAAGTHNVFDLIGITATACQVGHGLLERLGWIPARYPGRSGPSSTRSVCGRRGAACGRS